MSSATPKPRVECSKPNEHSLRSYDAVPEAVEMTASWKALRSSHKPWKSRARFPHFHRTATATLTLKSTQKGGLPQLPALPLLQAHSSIRKDCDRARCAACGPGSVGSVLIHRHTSSPPR